jgi:GNAT superfamily N-acetyltransferase
MDGTGMDGTGMEEPNRGPPRTDEDAPDFTLRPARPEDEDFLFALFVTSRERELSALPLPPDQAESFARMQYRSQLAGFRHVHPGAVELVVETAEGPVGRIVLEDRPGELWVVDLALMPDHRNAGLGAALLRHCMKRAVAERLVMRGSVTPYNPARRLYARLGIVELPSEGGATIPLEWRPQDS